MNSTTRSTAIAKQPHEQDRIQMRIVAGTPDVPGVRDDPDPVDPSNPPATPPTPTPTLATLTYDPELGPGYFVQTRSDFLRFPGFSPTAKVLYLVLCSYAGAGADAWPGQVRLARECGVSERTIRDVTADLVKAGLLAVKQQGLNRPNLYHVHKLPTTFPPSILPATLTTPTTPTTTTTPTNLPNREQIKSSKGDRQILPIQQLKGDRQNLPLLTGRFCRSGPANSAGELHPGKLHPEKKDSVLPPPPSPSTHSTQAARMVVGVEGGEIKEMVIDGMIKEKQVSADMQLLRDKVGINEHLAWELALLVAQRGSPEGYVAEVVEYATATVGINNPAGCVIELIRRNERRKPHEPKPSKPSPQPSSCPQPFDIEKYTTGKYAFLFQRPPTNAVKGPKHRGGGGSGDRNSGSDGNIRGDDKVIGGRSIGSGRNRSKSLENNGGENREQVKPNYHNGPDSRTVQNSNPTQAYYYAVRGSKR